MIPQTVLDQITAALKTLDPSDQSVSSQLVMLHNELNLFAAQWAKSRTDGAARTTVSRITALAVRAIELFQTANPV